MYKNLENSKTDSNLYAGPGQKVEAVYKEMKDQKKTKTEIIQAMEKKITDEGPEKISAHMGDFSKVQVADIADNLIKDEAKKAKFISELQTLKGSGEIRNYYKPPADPAHHVEIPQPKEVAK